MTKLQKGFLWDFFIIFTSSEQYNEHFHRREDLGNVREHEEANIVFDDILEFNQKLIDPYFTWGRRKDSDVYYLSQSKSDSLKKQWKKVLFSVSKP